MMGVDPDDFFDWFAEEVTKVITMHEDKAIIEPPSIRSRFFELLAQHPELTRPQAYMQAVMEIAEPAIGAAAASLAVSTRGSATMGPPVMRIISAGETSVITFPQNTTLEDFDRMTAEIRDAVAQAELRGEQKATAFLMGEGGGAPVGIIGQPEKLTETGDGSLGEFIQEFTKAPEFMSTMLRITVQEFNADRETNDHQTNPD